LIVVGFAMSRLLTSAAVCGSVKFVKLPNGGRRGPSQPKFQGFLSARRAYKPDSVRRLRAAMTILLETLLPRPL